MGRGGYRFRQVALLVYAKWGPCCWVCLHRVVGGVAAGGQCDHVVPACEDPSKRFSVDNLRPIHGGTNRCMECDAKQGVACNQLKGARSLEYTRRKLKELYGWTPPAPRNPGRPW